MFDLYDNHRLTHWKKFRDSLENSQTPFDDVCDFWSKAPFVSQYLDCDKPETWPDPWHLVIDGKFDDLAICLGMFYTLKLTQRFMDAKYEIHKSMLSDDQKKFFLIVNRLVVLNFDYGVPIEYSKLEKNQTSLIYKT